MGSNNTYHEELKAQMNSYVHLAYSLTKKFPREEIYGVTSQLRRAALSVVLNYIEGYARGRNKVHKNFLEISYGSLKESKYLLHFSLIEKYITSAEYNKAMMLAEKIGAMLWGIINKL
jgi:four helix bundle protein